MIFIIMQNLVFLQNKPDFEQKDLKNCTKIAKITSCTAPQPYFSNSELYGLSNNTIKTFDN